MRRYVRRAVVMTEQRKIVANDDYTEVCDRCDAEVGKPCTLQTLGFRQWPNISTSTSTSASATNTSDWVPIGAVALRIHWERRQAVLKTRKRNDAVEQAVLKTRQRIAAAATQPRPGWIDAGSPEIHMAPRRDITLGPMDPDDVVEPEVLKRRQSNGTS